MGTRRLEGRRRPVTKPIVATAAGTVATQTAGEAEEQDYERPQASESVSRVVAYAGPYLFWVLAAVLLTGTWLL